VEIMSPLPDQKGHNTASSACTSTFPARTNPVRHRGSRPQPIVLTPHFRAGLIFQRTTFYLDLLRFVVDEPILFRNHYYTGGIYPCSMSVLVLRYVLFIVLLVC
jgi:hypothetical protein